MALETGTYISDLVATNPAVTDPKSQGDDHLRLVKSTVKATFPNITGPVTASHTELSYMAGATTQPAMKDGSNLVTPTAGDSSTKIATTAFVTATAFSAALPAQTGNAGKFVTTNGTTASWASIVTGISTVNSTVTTSTTLSGGYLYVPVQMASMGQSVTLPNATTLTVGGPQYVIDNTQGGYPVGIRDNSGTLLMAVAAGGEALVSLKDKSTAAGVWTVTGTNLEPGLITLDSTFSNTYQQPILAPFVSLDNNTSIHFAALTAGFAAYVVDNAGKVVSTPVTVSSTAGETPAIAFKVSATTAIVFYGAGTTSHKAVVLSLTGSSPSFSISVGTPQSLTATMGSSTSGWDGENFFGAPKVAQLASALYVASYVAGANTNAVAISVSGTTVTIGAPVNIVTSSSVAGTTCTLALTSTTALVLYVRSAAPNSMNAVVVSVSGTTCTAGTPAVQSAYGHSQNPPFVCLVSPTKAIVVLDGNANGISPIALTISGTTVSWGSTTAIGSGSGNAAFTASGATRYNPHLWVLTTGSTNTVGLWWLDTGGISCVSVLSETSGTITAGTIYYYTISQTNSGSGYGVILPQGTTEFVSSFQRQASTAGYSNAISANKISGATITVGGSAAIPQVAVDPSRLFATRMSTGKYVLYGIQDNNNMMASIPVFASNGDAISYFGAISTPLFAAGGATNGMGWVSRAVSSNRLVITGYAFVGVGTGSQVAVRLLNVEIAA